MSRVDLSNIDLNLLKAFDALCYEGSVTRAAARLSIGQPAMSHALGRLRQLLDDELFVKTPRGMEPTARAQTLLKPVRAALDQIARALNDGHAFDPRTDLSVFRVGMLDFVAAGLLPGLLTNVNGAAPGVKFELHTIPLRRLNAQLDEGLLDMVVSFALPDAEWQRHEVLLRETHRCVFNERLVQGNGSDHVRRVLDGPAPRDRSARRGGDAGRQPAAVARQDAKGVGFYDRFLARGVRAA
jgi:LysR family transcriptional activator of mexEF-oprN operon